MKMLIFSAMLFIAASSFTTPVATKSTKATYNCFNFFRAHRQAKNVELSWAVSTPDVAQFVVESSYDGQYFNSIGQMNGNMGTQKFKDMNVYPGYTYYRITAVKTDGSTETSGVEVVRIVAH
jgi:hypothetical protein